MSEDDKINSPRKNCFELSLCNVCAIANLRCHLDLSHIAQTGVDVEYDSSFNVLKTKLRKPKVGLAQFWSNGKMSAFGCDSIDNARKGCRILARRIQKLGYNAKFENFQIVNILSKLQLPYKIKIHELVNSDKVRFLYEPELDPNLYYYPNPKNRGRRFNEYKTMAKITTNGKVTIHSSSMNVAYNIAQIVFDLSRNYRYDENWVDLEDLEIRIENHMQKESELDMIKDDKEKSDANSKDLACLPILTSNDSLKCPVSSIDLEADDNFNPAYFVTTKLTQNPLEKDLKKKRVLVQTYNEIIDNDNNGLSSNNHIYNHMNNNNNHVNHIIADDELFEQIMATTANTKVINTNITTSSITNTNIPHVTSSASNTTTATIGTPINTNISLLETQQVLDDLLS